MRSHIWGPIGDDVRFEFCATMCLVTITCATAVILPSMKVNADDVTDVIDTVNIDIPSACTMSGSIATGQEHNATVNPNTYQNNIGKTTITTTCNDSGGYAIYAIGFTGNEYSGADHTKLIGSTTNQKISTGTAQSGSSQWAMRVTAVSGTYAPTIENSFDSSNYHVVPDTYTKVASYNSATDTGINAIGSSIETTYAVYIAGTQPSDTYTGKVKYTLVHPSTETPLQPQPAAAGKIVYHPNGSNVVGTMGQQSAGNSASVTLLASNFSREGYGFAGWSTTFDYSDPNGFYGPQEEITTPSDTSTNGLSLYAYWVKSAGSLQSWSGCSSSSTGAVTALTDQRDNDTYAVAKLADGNCWMIENLRLDNTNSDNSTGTLSQGYGISPTYGNFSGLADTENSNFSGSIGSSANTLPTEANSLYYAGTQSGTATIDIGQIDYASLRIPRYNNDNTLSRASNPTSNFSAMYSYGNYYTWSAAIADTGYYYSNNTSVANTSLCPSGWRLPKGGNKTRITSNSDNDFWNLTVTGLNSGETPANYESSEDPYYDGNTEAGPVTNKLRAYPNNFLYSGQFYSSSVANMGVGGYYWSSTTEGQYFSYYLNLQGTKVYPGTNYSTKPSGHSIRCISAS